MSYGKDRVQLRRQVRRNKFKVVARVLFYRAGGRAGANMLIMWRDVRAKLVRLNQPRGRVRPA
jgi:hypothetical protein